MQVSNDKQLARDFEEIAAALSSMDNEWDRRVQALRRLQSLALGGAAAFETFVPQLVRLREPVAAQLLDLRSSVVRDATRTIELVCEALRDSAEPIADYWVDNLIKLVGNGTRIMAEYGSACLRAMLRTTRVTHRGVARLLETLAQSKNAFQRTAVADALCAVFLNVAKYAGTLDRVADSAESTMRSSICDSAPGVRSVARVGFWGFYGLWPDRGERVLAALDPSVRRLVVEERRRAAELMDEGSGAAGGGVHRKTSSAAAGLQQGAGGLSSSSKSAASDDSLASLTAVKVPAGMRGGVARGPANGMTTKFAGSDVSDLLSRRSSQVETNAARPAASQPSRVVTVTRLAQQQPPPQQQQQQQQPMLTQHGSLPGYKFALGPPNELYSSAPPYDAEPTLLSPTAESDATFGTYARRSPSPRPPTPDIAQLVDATNAPAWSESAAAFAALAKRLASPDLSGLTGESAERLAASLELHLDDPHTKVASAALDAAIAAFRAARHYFAPHVERLLPALATRAPAPVVRDVIAASDPEAVVRTLLAMSEGADEVAACRAVELLSAVVALHPRYFDAHMRSAVAGLVPMLDDRSPARRHSALNVLALLQATFRSAFDACCRSLPRQQQAALSLAVPLDSAGAQVSRSPSPRPKSPLPVSPRAPLPTLTSPRGDDAVMAAALALSRRTATSAEAERHIDLLVRTLLSGSAAGARTRDAAIAGLRDAAATYSEQLFAATPQVVRAL
eukprot:m51a1_g12880 hypothetical protein (737) ;mRNA; f:693-3268